MEDLDNLSWNITKWKIEAESAHNDGWIQNYYREKLLKIKNKFKEYSEEIPNYKIHGKSKNNKL
jgi:hypothetical protein